MAETKTVTAATTEAPHAKPFPPLDATTFAPQLFWLVLSFVLLYVMLKRLVLPRVGEVIGERQERISRDVAEARRIKVETETAIADYERALADARARAQRIAQESRDVLAAEIAKERAAVESKIAAKTAEAEKSIAAAKTSAMAQVEDVATQAAKAVVVELIGLDPAADEVQRALKG
ncbi:MAG: ATP F0F1 synthase subunit B [Hyphomicrobiaceae bacterium]|nr:MAG: ATP F0F1 synthase subunit B [Hyphomicrobiaceae bacterium]